MNENETITQTYLNDILPLMKTRIRNNNKYVDEYIYNANNQLIKQESYKLLDGQKINVEITTHDYSHDTLLEYKYDKKGMLIYYYDGFIEQNNLPPKQWIYEYYD